MSGTAHQDFYRGSISVKRGASTIVIALLAALGLYTYYVLDGDRSIDLLVNYGTASEKPARNLHNSTTLANRVKKHSPSLMDRYESAESLSIFFDEMKAESQSGDGEATRLLARIYEECWSYNWDPVGFQSSQKIIASAKPKFASQINAAFNTIAKRCDGLDLSSLSETGVIGILKTAADQGDLASEIMLLANAAPSHQGSAVVSDSQSRRKLLDRALSAMEPNALSAAAMIAGPTAAGFIDQLHPYPAGSIRAEAAWRLAACDMGMNCGRNSAFLREACAFGGICGYDSVYRFYTEGLLPRSDLQLLENDRNAIKGRN